MVNQCVHQSSFFLNAMLSFLSKCNAQNGSQATFSDSVSSLALRRSKQVGACLDSLEQPHHKLICDANIEVKTPAQICFSHFRFLVASSYLTHHLVIWQAGLFTSTELWFFPPAQKIPHYWSKFKSSWRHIVRFTWLAKLRHMVLARRFLWFKHGCPQSDNIGLYFYLCTSFCGSLFCFCPLYLVVICETEDRSSWQRVHSHCDRVLKSPIAWQSVAGSPDLFVSLSAPKDPKLWPMSMKLLEAPLSFSRVRFVCVWLLRLFTVLHILSDPFFAMFHCLAFGSLGYRRVAVAQLVFVMECRILKTAAADRNRRP